MGKTLGEAVDELEVARVAFVEAVVVPVFDWLTEVADALADWLPRGK